MKQAKTDANHAILTKRVKIRHEKKPVSNLLSMQRVDFEQTFMKFSDSECVMSWPVSNKYIYEIYKGREMHRHSVQGDTFLFICYC